MFHLFRHQHDRVNEGLVDASSGEARTMPYVHKMLRKPGSKEGWIKNKAGFPETFVSEIDNA